MNRDTALSQAQTLFEQGAYAEAHAILESLPAPRDHRVWRALGLLNLRLDRPEAAETAFQEAVSLRPDDPEIRFSLALHRLSQGDFKRGFEDYEARMEFGQAVATVYTRRAPFWDGKPLGPETPLLIHCEQGFGDSIQFIRFLPRVRERAQTLYLACHRELYRLLADMPGVPVFTQDHEIPPFARQLPLLSLGRILEVTPETIPTPIPYLSVPAAPLPPSPRPRVGLVWRAKPPGGRNRTIPLESLRSLAGLPVDWVLLQKDVTREEAAFLQEVLGAEERGSGLRDFRETAEIMQALDLVVTVDTSSAHLAGALGRPGWVLLPQWADWRWAGKNGRSIWYPTLELFPQEREGDWTAQIAAVRRRLGAA
ncbi:MAG: tetratricopeptide repeat protein [Verrucomicrobium sp.]|nr:tetratricopeptide repeat protein [Verrucomicrobium sp.]